MYKYILKMKVLIIDDEPAALKLLRKVLVDDNFSVDVAVDGKEGFLKAKAQKKYDVVILDLLMPEKSGFEFITSLRALNIDTPILVISALSAEADCVRALDSGADDYLVKGCFSLKEFVSRVKVLMRRKNQSRRNIFKVGDLMMNFSDISVTYKNKRLDCSRKEFGILAVLVKRKNSVVSREELTEAAWCEKNADFSSNTIDVHIRALRKKIGDNNVIETVRGYGYIIRG